jgi:hypothetical protein
VLSSLDIDARIERVDRLITTTPDPPNEIVLANTADEVHLEFDAAPRAPLASPAESTAANASELVAPAILETIDLDPGASERLTVWVGLASCDPSVGYVPSGDSQLIVLIDERPTLTR